MIIMINDCTLRWKTRFSTKLLHDVRCNWSEEVEDFIFKWNELNEPEQCIDVCQLLLTLSQTSQS